MRTFKEHCQFKQLAEYCEITNTQPEEVINEFWNWFRKKPAEQPISPPLPEEKEDTRGTIGIHGIPDYTDREKGKFKEGAKKSQLIIKQLRDGFKKVTDEVGMNFSGKKASEFFDNVKMMMDRFINNEIIPRIKVKMSDDEDASFRRLQKGKWIGIPKR
jgi:hypothetical protein